MQCAATNYLIYQFIILHFTWRWVYILANFCIYVRQCHDCNAMLCHAIRCTYLLTYWLTHSLIVSLIVSLAHSLSHLLTCLLAYLLTYVRTYVLTYLLTHWLTRLLAYYFDSSVYLCAYFFRNDLPSINFVCNLL